MNKVSFLILVGIILVVGVGFFIFFKSQGPQVASTQTQEPLAIGTGAPDASSEVSTAPIASSSPTATIKPVVDVKELKIEDIKVGTGDLATSGKKITVNYKGTLTDGTQFDSSYDRGQPFSFTLGEGRVIQGWEKGFEGMKVGGKRKLTIPSDLGYGTRGAPPSIPPNATLIFEVELLKVE